MAAALDLVQRYPSSVPEISPISLDDPTLFINREISWIRFNCRVLEEAQDPWHPLLERAKFLAICGSNMDEFFMTRVSRLLKKKGKGKKKRSLDKKNPYKQIISTRQEIIPLLKDYGKYWREELVPDLAREGIRIQHLSELNAETKRHLREYFEKTILPSFDLPIKDFHDVFVENLRINLFVVIRDSETDKEAYYIVKAPTDRFPRLVEIPKDDSKSSTDDSICYVFLEDLIKHNLDLLFPGSNITSVYKFRLTRNAEIDIIMDESADFLEVMKRSVETRRVGFPTRLQYERRMPRRFREILADLFGLASYLHYACDAPLGLVDLWQLLKIERPDLKDRSFLPYSAPLLRGLNHGKSLLETISKNDFVLYHPYDGFEVIIDLLRESARDPDVVSIKITVYRMDPRSPIVDALMEAAKNGKKVTAFIELKAKFDEEHNIDLAKHLQKAGVVTVYRFPKNKVHAKLCLIERREKGKLVRYSHIGSGNYNAVTTKIYGDTGYLTARQEIGAELASLFKFLSKNTHTKDYKYLLVAPKTLKNEILKRIDREIECHRRNGSGYLAFKLNGLEEKEIIQALYRASMAGVRCELNVRGLCCLRPGIPGISENITVISIVGRFLEHARIYYFSNGGKDEVLLGSSDMMFRNLNKRVEVLFSVPDQRIKRSILKKILMVHLKDNVKARRLLPDGKYVRVICPEGSKRINSQDWLIKNRGVWHAGPKHPSGLEDGNFYTFGARTIINLLTKLENQIGGAQEGQDIEYIHQLRVASRRLRAAMPIFRGCFPRKRFKVWTKEMKQVTRSFGAARDLDVQIVFLEKCQEAFRNKPAEPGIEYLLANHRKRRADIQTDVVRSLKKLRQSNILADMGSTCGDILNRTEAEDIFESDAVVEAFSQISERLHDFLSMEKCVYKEDLIAEHHEMRILAKRLRYTMEIFSPHFVAKLKDEISTMKQFQDALGDMHDYAVWIENLPKFLEEARTNDPEASDEVVRGLDLLIEHIRDLWQVRYKDFVSLWNETQGKGIFQKLRLKIQDGLASRNDKIKILMENPNPKIGLMADIHGNLRALEAVLIDAECRGVDVFLNAGDLIGYGLYPNEIVDTLRSQGVLSIKGNFDIKATKRKCKKKDVGLGLVVKKLSKSARTYLDLLPDKIILELKGKKILLSHGSPESVKEPILPNTPRTKLRRLAQSANADIIVLGHTHMPFARTIDGVKFVNPGSVGRPYDGNPKASYAILRMEPVSIELVRVDYDRESTAHEMRRAGLPEDYVQMLLRGVVHDVIEADDVKLGHQLEAELKDRLRIVKEVAGEYGGGDGHSKQVRRLALKLFDDLEDYHGLGVRERYLLECGAFLHDIGWSEGQKGHNKTSLKLILNNQKLPFTSVERNIVGCLARYHRKGFPKSKHHYYHILSSKDRNKVLALSSLLRVADGLDYSHKNMVRKLSANTEPDKVIIRCIIRGDPIFEERQFDKKKDFFEKTFKTILLIEWH